MDALARESKKYLGVALTWKHLLGIAALGAGGFLCYRYGRNGWFLLRKMIVPSLVNRITGRVKEALVLSHVVQHANEGVFFLFMSPPSPGGFRSSPRSILPLTAPSSRFSLLLSLSLFVFYPN